jgi:hypothetical protein
MHLTRTHLREVFPRQIVDFPTWGIRSLRKAEEFADILEAESKATCAMDEPHTVHIGNAVDAVPGVTTPRSRQQANALVVPNGFHVASRGARCRTDVHVLTL